MDKNEYSIAVFQKQSHLLTWVEPLVPFLYLVWIEFNKFIHYINWLLDKLKIKK